MPSRRESSRQAQDRAVRSRVNSAMAKDPGQGPKGHDLTARAAMVMNSVPPTTDEQKLDAGRYVRRYAVANGLKMSDIQDVLDALNVP